MSADIRALTAAIQGAAVRKPVWVQIGQICLSLKEMSYPVLVHLEQAAANWEKNYDDGDSVPEVEAVRAAMRRLRSLMPVIDEEEPEAGENDRGLMMMMAREMQAGPC